MGQFQCVKTMLFVYFRTSFLFTKKKEISDPFRGLKGDATYSNRDAMEIEESISSALLSVLTTHQAYLDGH